MCGRQRGQIALEFIIVYSVVLVIFILVFGVISGQRAATLNAQQASIANIEAQEIASYINHAISAGSGYTTTLTLAEGPGASPYNIFISTSGAVIINSTNAGEPVSAYAFSDGRNMSINGSLQYGNGGGAGIYQIPAYTGVIKISNIGGTVYIDRNPVSNANLLGASILSDVEEGYAPLFNGASSYVVASNPFGTNWWYFYLTNAGNIGAWSGSTWVTGAVPPLNTWSHACFTFGSGTLTLYLNGVSTGSGAGTQSNTMSLCAWIYPTISSKYQDLASFWDSTSSMTIGLRNPPYGDAFQGSIADVQIYNSLLSQNQITALYNEGPLGAPMVQNSIVGWWPLDGNANDYSGSGNNGNPSNIRFETMARLVLNTFAKNGTALSNVPVGIVMSNGTANGGTSAFHGLSSSGVFNTVVLYNSINPNATVYAFGGNLSTVNSLVGWWPLSRGDLAGNTIYDLSPGGDNGIGASQKPLWNMRWQRG